MFAAENNKCSLANEGKFVDELSNGFFDRAH
jgi:hypothetical protein